MTQTVATTTDTDQPTTKPAGDLQPGDWFVLPESDGEAAEVLSAHPDKDDRVFLVYSGVHDRVPTGLRCRAAQPLPVCSPEQVERATGMARRFEIAVGLENFADLIRARDLPLPSRYSGATEVRTHLRSVAEVEAVSVTLDIPTVTEHGQCEVVWPANASYDAPFRAVWTTYVPREPKPEPAAKPTEDTGLGYSRPSDGDASPAAVPAGVDGATLGKRGPKK